MSVNLRKKVSHDELKLWGKCEPIMSHVREWLNERGIHVHVCTALCIRRVSMLLIHSWVGWYVPMYVDFLIPTAIGLHYKYKDRYISYGIVLFFFAEWKLKSTAVERICFQKICHLYIRHPIFWSMHCVIICIWEKSWAKLFPHEIDTHVIKFYRW